ncbi:catalase family peroxidase [Gluconacetobacter diazotrophicus]|uniref:Catalase-related peroxidase n=1 Tax=Gluconacetobacter diazotrophicus TaxID=33996 RepID=A0A7W4FCC3_GLUDI|nr:catalase family peroxidase [Gluconacetobacter diazotrophicus]MBB2154979.1 catalase family peroxidase [Gluconacetobacter diazotrophicus]
MPGPPDKPGSSRVPLRLTPGTLGRLGVIGAVMLALCGAFAWDAGVLSSRRLTQGGVMAALRAVDGLHPGFRRNHAKGLCVTGWFQASGQAAALSTASLFRPGRVPVVGRFALAGGMPFQPDAPAKVRSMALRLMPPDGQEWRMGINDIPVFVARTAQEFRDLLLATRPDPATGKPDPARIGPFLSAHQAVATALGRVAARPLTSGFGDDTYYSLDTFRFVDAGGASVPVRWAMVPLQPVQPAGAGGGPDYLFDDLAATLRRQPLQWRLVVTVGDPSDPTADPTLPWPSGRRQVDAGLLTLDRAESEDGGPCTGITYDPVVLPPGITLSDDPIPAARSAAYMRSFTLRSGEAKPPSAVTPAMAGAGGGS